MAEFIRYQGTLPEGLRYDNTPSEVFVGEVPYQLNDQCTAGEAPSDAIDLGSCTADGAQPVPFLAAIDDQNGDVYLVMNNGNAWKTQLAPKLSNSYIFNHLEWDELNPIDLTSEEIEYITATYDNKIRAHYFAMVMENPGNYDVALFHEATLYFVTAGESQYTDQAWKYVEQDGHLALKLSQSYPGADQDTKTRAFDLAWQAANTTQDGYLALKIARRHEPAINLAWQVAESTQDAELVSKLLFDSGLKTDPLHAARGVEILLREAASQQNGHLALTAASYTDDATAHKKAYDFALQIAESSLDGNLAERLYGRTDDPDLKTKLLDIMLQEAEAKQNSDFISVYFVVRNTTNVDMAYRAFLIIDQFTEFDASLSLMRDFPKETALAVAKRRLAETWWDDERLVKFVQEHEAKPESVPKNTTRTLSFE